MMQYNCGYSSAGHLVTVIPLGIENRFTNGKKNCPCLSTQTVSFYRTKTPSTFILCDGYDE